MTDKYGCEVCRYHNLEQGDTLYRCVSWDGGIGYDYINNIHFCPVCEKELPSWEKQYRKAEEKNNE